MRPTGSAEELERRRRHAVGMVGRGESRATVARVLGVHIKTLARWCRADRRGADGLAARPVAGPKPRLTDGQVRELGLRLSEGAVAHGWANELWTTTRVARVIEKWFGVNYHPAHVSVILRKRLKWTCQKPEQHYKGRDDKAIALWGGRSSRRSRPPPPPGGRGWSSPMRRGSCSSRPSAGPTPAGGRRRPTAPATLTDGSRESARSRSVRGGTGSSCDTPFWAIR